MMSTNNILHPANGMPIIVPSQDIVLGLYYVTLMRDGEPGQGMAFADIGEIEHAIAAKATTLHAKIRGRGWTYDANGKKVAKLFDTTPGRMILGQLLPDHVKIPFDVVNKLMTKKEISNMIDTVYRNCGQKETVIFCDRIMSLGFREAFKAGISFGKDDMVVPDSKPRFIAETSALAKEYEQQYNDGLITQGEKYNKVVDAWAKCSDKLAEEMMIGISTVRKDAKGRDLPINSIYMMSHSGARGSPTQMRQLAAMRGLMAKPSGEIIESPIIANFKEGLSVLEYFNSTHGARKGLADTALKTANSGYLTRRLVDVAQDSIITTPDCGSTGGIRMRAIIDAGQVVASLAIRILGRTTAEDLKELDGTMIVPAGEMIVEEHIDRINAAGIQEVKIRSVLTCEAENGVCGKCYGRDLARGTPVNMGEAVGVIAAQSIGEPGTQLTMRTFHIGGAAQLADQSFIESNFDGEVRIRNRALARNTEGDMMVMARNVAVVIVGRDGAERAVHRVQYGARLKVEEGDQVKRGQRIAEWDPYTRPILTEVSGAVGFEDLVEGASMSEQIDEATGIAKRVVTDWRMSPRSANLRPAITIKGKDGKLLKLARGGDARYMLPVDSILSFEPGSHVNAGDVVARISIDSAKTRDITGGLPRVAELFEARRPKDHAIIAEISGTVQFGRDYKNKQRLSIVPSEEGAEPVEYLIAKSKHIHLQDGDVVEKGDYIVDGNPAPHDILAIKGVEELAAYLVNEIQEVYRLQGVSINDKHIEVIVRQMLQKVDIVDPGDTDFLPGEQIDLTELEAANEVMKAESKKLATGTPVLLGITKASLQTRSFISAASFQETTRVLTEAAVNGKVDTLEGLKENVIVGRLIPAGTGAAMTKMRSVATMRDALILAQKAEASSAAALPTPAIASPTPTPEPVGARAR
jgi:DNA-directed RNA polymerase subunit beta'